MHVLQLVSYFHTDICLFLMTLYYLCSFLATSTVFSVHIILSCSLRNFETFCYFKKIINLVFHLNWDKF